MVCGLLAMSTKFTECVLGQIYRRANSEGVVLGGPMRYLRQGFRLRKLIGFSMAPFGMLLSWTFAILCICVSLTAGNAFQVSQALGGLQHLKEFEPLNNSPWIFGVGMMVAVAVVVLGGIRLLGTVSAWLSPLACVIYAGACGWVIAQHSANLEAAFQAIFTEAFEPTSLVSGGFIGVLLIGLSRASLSSDAGLGTSSIIHSATRTDEPVREGLVAMLEPFIVTVCLTLLTALAMGVTGVAATPDGQELAASEKGTALVLKALTDGSPEWFALALQGVLLVFAYSTCITWAYFGERCFVGLLGESFSYLYKFIFIAFTFLGSVVSAVHLMQFSYLLMLTMAIPNLIGVVLLSGVAVEELDDYWHHYRNRGRNRTRSLA